ncbi:MerR family transcriptional regulator [Actinoplanes sp. LDG1-06]|uniref:MerR family transcriptional regulator n=1 Tax=Paractinoplanes ovalisporus TaxID=2810368 RepID=A0ABS2ANQ5_9ACTN|nr:MerR family transcriptional regulator [Actinoplanes ovalisporus]MBM2621008.1 MerR family transcriptional regulator [Actinoplanes ovalisporus]
MDQTIGELAERFGLATHVLRHWEEEGLLSPVRDGNGRRVYGEADTARVAEILLCKEAGFSLDQLRDLFAAPGRARRDELLREQLGRVRERIVRLQDAQALLEHGLRCRHENYRECPRFREMVLSRTGA